MMRAVADAAAAVAAQVPLAPDRVALIAVDGVDGSGKTTFAATLRGALLARTQFVQIVHLDDFHNLREVRYRLGRDSPEGFFLDSYDYGAFVERVIRPLRDGTRRIQPAATDLTRNEYIDPASVDVPVGGVVVVEGIFAHRDELYRLWDWSVFLDVPFETSVARMAERDGSADDPGHPSIRRYVEGQRIYLERCDPKSRASLVLDYS
ncbi:uridine kinase [Gryllotalpicola daejeonensis]|uniref:Uridine kinase n=1 Tax=Gryllotalpicola daejeonensis TaxID=993087 RepID=A0ABP7ZDW1_9MICO